MRASELLLVLAAWPEVARPSPARYSYASSYIHSPIAAKTISKSFSLASSLSASSPALYPIATTPVLANDASSCSLRISIPLLFAPF